MSMKLYDNMTGFQHMGFPTNDLAETIAFYEKLGMKKANDVMEYDHIEWTAFTVE